MVPSKEPGELRDAFDRVKEQALPLDEYEGDWSSVASEMTTADTFLAGIASRLLAGGRLEPAEDRLLQKPLVSNGRQWRLSNGCLFDLEPDARARRYALDLDDLRERCRRLVLSKAEA